jgi:uncharacterized membrane protein YbaN (DUF454 family)
VIPSRARKFVDWVVGLVLIALGILGGFLPIVQGWLLILAGLAVLSSHSRLARRVLDGLKRWKQRLRDWIRRRRADPHP